MLHECKKIYPEVIQCIKSGVLNLSFTRVTHAQEKIMRALDLSITDLLHELHDCVKGVIKDSSTAENYSSL